MESVLIIGAVLAIPILIVWLAWRQQVRARANLQALAARLGLQVVRKPGLPGALGEAVGTWSQRALRCYVFATGSGKSRQTWCAVAVRPRSVGDLTFEIRRQNFGTQVMTWFGAKEIQVGDPAFDQAWFVQTNQAEFFGAALVPEIRAQFMALPKEAGEGGFKLVDGEVRYAVRGYFSDAKIGPRLEARLPLLRDLADVAEVFSSEGGAR